MSVNTQNMNNMPGYKSPDELKKIFQKSLKLLDSSQNELREVRAILKKTVSRLSAAADSSSDAVNAVLVKIKASVTDTVNIKLLDAGLDELFSVLGSQVDSGGRGKSKQNGFHQLLKSEFEQYNFSSLAIEYKTKIHELINSNVPDEVLSGKILDLLNELGIELNDACLKNDISLNEARNFERVIRQGIFNVVDVKKTDDIKVILDDLAEELLGHVKDLNAGRKDDGVSGAGEGSVFSLQDIFVALLDSLELSDSMAKRKKKIIRQVAESDNTQEAWIHNIINISDIINENILILRSDKKDLSDFISRITTQLSDIESYVKQTQLDRKDVVSQSARLRDSLDESVSKIQHEVGAAEQICQLKQDVQVHLETIKNNIEKHKQEEEKQEAVSKDKYLAMLNELEKSRKKTEKLKEQLEDSKTQLLRDTLTGLPNRLAYTERVTIEKNRSQRSKEPLCLAMWDIDHFKNINDTYGHDAGDKVLKLFAKIIVGRVRKTDMFARIGGEEFVLLMPNTPAEVAMVLNNELRESLEKYKFHYNGELCPVTSSVGIAEFEDGLEIDEVYKRADKALYISKNSGRNQCTLYRDDVP